MKKKKKNETDPDEDFLWPAFGLAALIFFFIPALVNIIFKNYNIKTAPGLGNSDWLSFWGSYIGSGLGVLTTFLAFSRTYKQNAKQNKDVQEQNRIIQEQNKIIQDQNKLAEKREQEQTRLQALPFINLFLAADANLPALRFYLDLNGYAIPKNEDCTGVVFVFENIGAGPAVDVRISSAELGHFSSGGSKKIRIGLPVVDKVDILSFEIKFFDRELREYIEHITLRRNGMAYKVSKVTPPELLS